jgi:hypothetical protein
VDAAPIPLFELNKLPQTNSAEQVARILQFWQTRIGGMDSFIFEYYDGAEDLAVARVMHQDILGLGAFGMNGLVSCQTLRSFFPTGLGMVAMAQGLWDRGLSYEQIAADYADAAFGAGGEECLKLIAAAQQSVVHVRRQLKDDASQADAAVAQLSGQISDLRGLVDRAGSTHDGDLCRRVSWRMVALFVSAAERYIQYARATRDGLAQTAQIHRHALRDQMLAAEDEVQPYLQSGRLVRSWTGG